MFNCMRPTNRVSLARTLLQCTLDYAARLFYYTVFLSWSHRVRFGRCVPVFNFNNSYTACRRVFWPWLDQDSNLPCGVAFLVFAITLAKCDLQVRPNIACTAAVFSFTMSCTLASGSIALQLEGWELFDRIIVPFRDMFHVGPAP